MSYLRSGYIDLSPKELSAWSKAWLSAIRIVAAVAVVLGHARGLALTDYEPNSSLIIMSFYFISSLGHEAVIIFFVLSGFWITKSFLRDITCNSWSVGKYLIDRLSRLWTVLIPALILGGIVDYFGMQLFDLSFYSGRGGGNVIIDDTSLNLSMRSFFLNVLFLQNGIVEPFGTNKALWSISNEFWYYMLFPLFYWTHKSLAAAVLLIVVGTFIVVCLPAILPGLVIWLAGSVLAICPKSRFFERRFAVVIAITSFVSLMAISKLLSFHGFWCDVAVALSFSTCLLAAAARERNETGPTLRVLADLGQNSSYSLYAIHLPILVAAVSVLFPGGRQPPSFFNLGLVVGLCGLSIGAGWLFSTFTERNTAYTRRMMTRLARNYG